MIYFLYQFLSSFLNYTLGRLARLTNLHVQIDCRFAFSEALKKMYGINHNWTSLPPMPIDGDTWSVMHSWVLPTRSFLEFVMFSRCENLHRRFDILLKQTLTIH